METVIEYIWICIILAGIIGAIAGWIFRGCKRAVSDTPEEEKNMFVKMDDSRYDDKLYQENIQLNMKLSKAENELKAMELKLKSLQDAYASKGKDFSAHSSIVESLKSKLSEHERSLEEKQIAIAKLQEENSRLKEMLNHFEDEKRALQGKIDELEKNISQKNIALIELEKKQQVLDECKKRVTTLSEKLELEQKRVQDLTNDNALLFQKIEEAPQAKETIASTSVTEKAIGKEPKLLRAPQGEADDLKRIKGIGEKIEKVLNELGIFHFWQIAQWSKDEIDWVNNYLVFSGRIEREKWVEQARELLNEKDSDENRMGNIKLKRYKHKKKLRKK